MPQITFLNKFEIIKDDSDTFRLNISVSIELYVNREDLIDFCEFYQEVDSFPAVTV